MNEPPTVPPPHSREHGCRSRIISKLESSLIATPHSGAPQATHAPPTTPTTPTATPATSATSATSDTLPTTTTTTPTTTPTERPNDRAASVKWSREEDRARVERVLAGDPEAFAEIYAAYFRRVYAFTLKRVRDPAEAEDLTQETFVQLYRSLPSFEGRSSLLTWTFGIAHHLCSRYYRHCSRWMVGSRNAQTFEDTAVESTVEQCIDASRALARCDEVLESSRREAHREIFRLHYAQRKSIRAIADEVGKSNEAVKVSLRRSRAAMARKVPGLDSVLDSVAHG